MESEYSSYDSSSANPATKSHKEQLKKKWKKRKAIYDAAGAGEN